MYSVDNLIPYDLEVYPNYFLAGFMLPDGTVYQYEITDEDNSQYQGLCQFINWVEQSDHTLVGFNSNGYDDPVLSEVLLSPSCSTGYRTSVAVIENNARPWDFAQDVFSIDLIRVLPGQMSLKKIGVCLGHTKLQELPINPHKNLTRDEMDLIKSYNINDLEITKKLAKEIYKELVLRQDLSRDYNIDLRSKGEAQVAEMILSLQIEQSTGLSKKQLKETARENALRNPNFQVHRASWFDNLPVDKYPTLQTVIDRAEKIYQRQIHIVDYKIEPGALTDTIFIGDRWYQMGIGGLHSVDGPGCWKPKDHETLMDVDVTSYYPDIMLKQKLSPRHWVINGVDHFQGAFLPIVEQRIIAKKAGDKTVADRLKIVINGTFGKTNDQSSSIYDPYIMASVTVTGQLALLTLVAMIHDIGGSVVSANTDGITILYDTCDDELVRATVSEWEAFTQHTMEYCEYTGFYQKDVNNYIAVTTDGELKTKGIFNIPKMGGVDLRHTPNYQIVARAVSEQVKRNKDIALTVTECEDIQEFLLTQQVRGDWSVKWKDMDLGKMVRFYKARGGSEIIRTPLHDGVKGNAGIVANSESSVPLPDLPNSFETVLDVDHEWYIKKADELLELITQPKRRHLNTLAMQFIEEGMVPTIIEKGKNNRVSPSEGSTDFTSMRMDECFAIATGRNYGVLAKRYADGRTEFYKVENKYPAKTRAKIMKDHDFELLFGSNIEAEAYSLLNTVDERYLDEFYTETELRKVR